MIHEGETEVEDVRLKRYGPIDGENVGGIYDLCG